MKKIIMSLIILICMFSSISVFADNSVSIGDVSVKVKKEVITVNASVSGYVDNIPFSVKCLNSKGEIEYIDYLYANYGYINTSFVPMNAEEGDALILKITGVTTITKTFTYSEKNTNEVPLEGKEKEVLEKINEYSIYEDMIGNIEFEIEMDVNKDYIKITMKGKDFKSSDNIWKNKDSDRWNAYLTTIADIVLKGLNKDVRINAFDSNKKLVDNKLFDSEGEWGQNIPKMIQKLNSKYKTLRINGKSYSVRYTRGDVDREFNLGDVLFLDTVVRGIDFDKLKDDDRIEVQDFFDEVYEYVKENCTYDTTFRVYDANKKMYQSFSYFSELKPEEIEYGPLDYSSGSFPIYLMNYGDNSVVIPLNSIVLSSKDGVYEASVENSSGVLAAMSSLKSGSPAQVVFGLDPTIETDKIKMNISSSVLKVLRTKNAILTLNNPFMQINIDTSDIDTSSSISFTVQKLEEKAFSSDIAVSKTYKVSLTDGSGNSIDSSNIKAVFRFDSEFNDQIQDIRKVNVYHSDSEEFMESEMMNGTYYSGLLGMIFAYAGDGYYRTGETDVYFYDIENHWAKDPISVLAAKGMVKGVSDSVFSPNTTISRAEFVVIISRHLGLTPKGGSSYYTDLIADWYINEVNAARDYNLLPETMTGNMFEPDKSITREEMAYITINAYLYATRDKLSHNTLLFVDSNSVSSWAYDHVSMAQELKIMIGNENNECKPQDTATRAEASQVIYNLLKSEKAF